MKTGIILLAALVSTGAQLAHGRETTTEIGRWTATGGSMSFSIREADGKKSAAIFVSDTHIIRTNYITPNKDQLLKLRALIDETLTEMDR